MNNGKSNEVIKQFDSIAFLPDTWDYNQEYLKYILKRLPKNVNECLDIGCGTGKLTKQIAPFCKDVIGIDISGNMIKEAIKRNPRMNIEYKKIDIDEYFNNNKHKYDLIITIATLHHLNIKNIFQQVKNHLNPYGMFFVLDLYKKENFYEYFLSGLAFLLNPILFLIKRKRLSNTINEKIVWKEHSKYDYLPAFKEILNNAREVFGKVEMKHHLFWRYSLIYRNNK